MSDLERIFGKLDEQGQLIARIDERTKNTSERLLGIDTKVDQMRTGEWDCPTAKEVRKELATHNHHDGNTVVKEENGLGNFKAVKKQIMTGAIGVAIVVVGCGLGFWFLRALFGG